MSSPIHPESLSASQESKGLAFPDFFPDTVAPFTDEDIEDRDRAVREGLEASEDEEERDLVEDEEDWGTPEAETEARADLDAIPKSRPEAGLMPVWEGVEDISDTQWHEAEQTRELRRGSEKNRELSSV